MTAKLLAGGLVLVLAAAPVAGCGVKGDPQRPEDKADGFPRTYPQGAVPTDTRPENIFVDRFERPR